jgi:acyl dehydratase
VTATVPVTGGPRIGTWQTGDVLPELAIDITTTFVVTTALASSDFMAVHHDRDAAQAQGAPDIFTNILCDTGLLSRYITDWAGPRAVITRIVVTLNALNPVGETLRISGQITALDAATGQVTVAVRADNSLGRHITAEVGLRVPGPEGPAA